MLLGHLSVFEQPKVYATGDPTFDMYGLKASSDYDKGDCHSYMATVAQFYSNTSSNLYFSSSDFLSSLQSADMVSICTHGEYLFTGTQYGNEL